MTDYDILLQQLISIESSITPFEAFTLEQRQEVFNHISDIYNAYGERLVDGYIESTRAQDELMVDGINPGGIETEVLHDPYMLRVFLPEYPPHLTQFTKTKYSRQIGYGMVTGRWFRFMSVALLELCKKGAVPFTEKVVIIYNYHFPKEIMDVDNYAIKTINDTFRDARIIKDDSVNYLSVHIQGEVNKGKKGLEIMVLREKDFYRLYIEEDSTV